MRQIVMIGPSPTARGGMASAIDALIKVGYQSNHECVFIPTHVDGSLLMKAWTATSALARFFWLLVRGRVRLLHAHVASGVSFWRKSLFIALAHLFSCPVVFHLHGGEFQKFLSRQEARPWHRYPDWVIERSARILALTSDMANWLGTRYAEVRIEVFPNPVAFLATTHTASNASKEILFLGRIDERKGIFDLLRAVALLRKSIPDAHLTVAGVGDVDSAKALATDLVIEDAVRFVGWVDEANRAALLARVAMVVLPSYHEQMPMAILEAMAAGVPVIATRIGAISEMLANGTCGVLVLPGRIGDLSAAMANTLNDRSSAAIRTIRAMERVHEVYSAPAVLAGLRQRYQEIGR